MSSGEADLSNYMINSEPLPVILDINIPTEVEFLSQQLIIKMSQ